MYIMNKKAIYESIMSQVAQVVKKQLNENMEHDEVWDIFEEMKEMLGAEELVNELAQALSTDELEENLRFIDKNHDLGLFRVNDSFDDVKKAYRLKCKGLHGNLWVNQCEIHQNPPSVKRQSGITAPLRVAFIPFVV